MLGVGLGTVCPHRSSRPAAHPASSSARLGRLELCCGRRGRRGSRAGRSGGRGGRGADRSGEKASHVVKPLLAELASGATVDSVRILKTLSAAKRLPGAPAAAWDVYCAARTLQVSRRQRPTETAPLLEPRTYGLLISTVGRGSGWYVPIRGR
jgi:hypothetical protein